MRDSTSYTFVADDDDDDDDDNEDDDEEQDDSTWSSSYSLNCAAFAAAPAAAELYSLVQIFDAVGVDDDDDASLTVL